MKILKKAISDSLAANFQITKMNAEKYVDFIFDEIGAQLLDGNEIQITGFGKFVTKDTPAKLGRNPKTGAVTRFSAKRKVKFLPAPVLREAVQESFTGDD